MGVSFVLAPLASNASDLLEMNVAAKTTQTSMEIQLCSLEGSVIICNTFCLGIFFLLMVCKQLVWEFTSETTAIVVIELVVAIVALKFKTQTLFHGVCILGLYPLSLLIVAL